MVGLFALLFIIFGIINAIYPQAGWYMKYGWQFKDAEPSDAALIMGRIGGVISIVVGIFVLFNFH